MTTPSSSSPDYATLGFTQILINLEHKGGIAIVTLNRAKYRNTFTKLLLKELTIAFELFDKDDRVRVVILTAGHDAPAYCSGADLTNGWDPWRSSKKPGAENNSPHADGGRLVLPIYTCRKLTIAAVNGDAAGIGITGLQLPFDFRFIWGGAKLTFPFVRRGISVDGLSSYLLPRLIGQSRATALLLSGLTVVPSSTLLSGLYFQILDRREDVLPAARAFALEMAGATSQVAVAYSKALIQRPGRSVEENHRLESECTYRTLNAGDAAEGVSAFLEKRKPVFRERLGDRWENWWDDQVYQYRKTKL
ncbi:hypothetical protein AMATHDRAFT_183700 [Amanita thiersii Skay4041]|uniref:Enoyl-CoA hydratase n=1 Tax=Amanita thiersii Skay4041 TaxID=703135 RepID=A0A2A9NET7_9AGAR|nr:hypothetical protein AMATHDRAFT_183700 [Amanita thiersii Skay4041]